MKRTNVHLSEQQIDRLDRLSKKSGISRAEIVRRAIDLYVGRADAKREKTQPEDAKWREGEDENWH